MLMKIDAFWTVLAYSANNVVSHSKRAVSTAIIVAFGGVGGIFATTAYVHHPPLHPYPFPLSTHKT